MSGPKSKGAMWPNSRRTAENQPEHTGKLEITDEQIRKLIEMRKANLEPIMQIALWNRTSKETGAPYMYLKTEVYMPEPEPQQQQAYQAPQPQYRQPPQQAPQQQAPAPDWEDDDIPF